MALVRILVDGSGLLRCWPAILPGKERQSPAVQEELIRRLTQYQDICGVPITVAFDGAGPARVADDPLDGGDVEVLFSRIGQTAAQLVGKTAQKMGTSGEVLLVVEPVAGAPAAKGVQVSGCEEFALTVSAALEEMERELKKHNDSEDARFRASGF
jgi:predicted RNA-binding protein with PIN domain